MWRHRHAIQIAAQLPENVEDALEVLRLAERLVREFLVERAVLTPESQRGGVLAFPRPDTAPSVRASSRGSPSGLPK